MQQITIERSEKDKKDNTKLPEWQFNLIKDKCHMYGSTVDEPLLNEKEFYFTDYNALTLYRLDES